MIHTLPLHWLTAFTPHAHAQIVSTISGLVSNGLTAGPGTFRGIVEALTAQVYPLLATVAIFLIVRAGLKLINSQDEGKLDNAKRTIASALVGLMLAPIGQYVFFSVYNSSGYGLGNPADFTLQLGGLLNWTLVLIVPLSILIIVVSGIKAIGSFGKEDGITEMRQTIWGVVLGIGILLVAGAIKATLGMQFSLYDVSPAYPGPPSADPIILRGMGIVMNALQFLALIAFAVILYAGGLMMLSLGNDDQYEKAKGIIFRALIGLAVVLLSVVIVQFVVGLLG